MPAPPTTIVREDVRFYSKQASGDDVVHGALGWSGGVWGQCWVVTVKGGAIRADVFGILAHVAEDVRMVVRRRGADAHELPGADLDDCNTWIVLKVRNDFVAHALVACCALYRVDFARTIAATGGDS